MYFSIKYAAIALLGLSSVAIAHPGTTPDGYDTKTKTKTSTKDGATGGKTCTKIQTTSQSVGSTVYTSYETYLQIEHN